MLVLFKYALKSQIQKKISRCVVLKESISLAFASEVEAKTRAMARNFQF